jgi:hypothetical protein
LPDGLEGRAGPHQGQRQVEQRQGAGITDLNDAVGVDHHQPLIHGVENGVEELRLLPQRDRPTVHTRGSQSSA